MTKKKQGFTQVRRQALAQALTRLLRELGWIGARERIEPKFELASEPALARPRTRASAGKRKNGRAK